MSFPLPSTPQGDDRMQDRIKFSDADFKVIADLAMRDFGLNLTSAKRDLVYSRLLKRLRVLGLEDFREYCALISGPNGTDERNAMLSALTTNVTHFFREEHHFKLLREVALPGLIKTAKEGGRVRIWSAGCSAGPEPYSLAFTVLSMFPEAARSNFRILATDVDPEILKKAEAGIYPEDERKGIPEAFNRFTESAGPGKFTIGRAARELITFGRLNLIEDWPISGPFQVIFCRNVAIYFDKPTQSRLWARFGDLLSPGGHLCIGHSERVLGPAEQMFKAVGITAYQRHPGIGRGAPSFEEPKK
ncbi:CheR family methyltransferase [Stagnihabitans tardus]|uniref:Chemotaxis protein methyltransferase n=1 Tax=Stagnihabitans tardus TaxID=2699202 RepID=A0AAE4YBZ5_9RHOB|nr:protein-glutamate O-methyltransferase [Stagnihabitans tardus]NBZ86880.1 chemotaxis protein [Stagnihabitans tardus]